MAPYYLRDSHGVVLLSDVLKERHEFDVDLRIYLKFLEEVFPTGSSPPPFVVVAGTKCDSSVSGRIQFTFSLSKDRKLLLEEARQVTRSLYLPYFESSAKNFWNISEPIHSLLVKIIYLHPHLNNFKNVCMG